MPKAGVPRGFIRIDGVQSQALFRQRVKSEGFLQQMAI